MDKTINSITYNPYLPKLLLFGDSITQRAYSYAEGKTFVFGAAFSDGMFQLCLQHNPSLTLS